MCDLTSGVFEHLDITSTMDVDQMVAYTQRIIIGAALKTYKAVLIECNHSVKDLAGDTWDLSALRNYSQKTSVLGIRKAELSMMGMPTCY